MVQDIANDVGGFKARWVRISVDMLEHPVLDRGPFDRRSAWNWLIANAAWKSKRINHKGKALELERGQVLIGRAHLAQVWQWTEQNVRTFLSQLVQENMLKINQSNGHFANIATICNYDKYQSATPEINQDDSQSLTSVQPEPNQTYTTTTTSTTKSLSSSTVLTEAARDEICVATPPEDFTKKILEAAQPCLANPVNSLGLLTEGTPRMWLERGADLERDILPTLRAAAQKYRGKKINTWGYFTGMIAEARAKRLAGLPTVSLKPTASASYTPSPRRGMSDAELEAAKERIGLEFLEEPRA